MWEMSKDDKRLQRLRLKTREKFLHQEPNADIRFMESPSRFLFVGNGGLECGVDYAILHDVFSEHGVVEKIVMTPHRPYAFVEMSAVMSEDAFKQIDGRRLTSSMMSPPPAIHLSYVNHLPELETCADANRTLTSMQTTQTLPAGLQVIPNFVNREEEDRLLAVVLNKFAMKNYDIVCGRLLRHRQVTHYGYEFIYGSNDVDLKKPLERKIPSECDFLIERMMVEGLLGHRPDQLTVNEYEPGQGIPPHIDTHSAFEDGIASLTLGAQTVMEFSHPIHSKCMVLLSDRSLLILSGESRYVWTHGIASRKTDIIDSSVFRSHGSEECEMVIKPRCKRVSLTFRTVRGTPCHCDYPEYCDRAYYTSQKKTTET